MPPTIDLRSDTKTKPTSAMYEAILAAEVGDDMAGEDPSVNRLEARMARMLGKEAAVLCCTATQSNQLALRVHCCPGDELWIHETGHIANFEGGAPAALGGISIRSLPGQHGFLAPETMENAWRPEAQHFPRTRLLCLENTTNLGGGAAWALEDFRATCQWARGKGLRVHLDGARIFNASVAKGYDVHEIAGLVDTVSVCFSKGLGCPFGSVLAGSQDDIAAARRGRRLFGGALRQAGIIAGAALYALDHHIERLAEDHANARALAESIATFEAIQLDPTDVETNIIFFEVSPDWGSAATLVDAVGREGVLLGAVGRQRIRAVTHLDVSEDDILSAARSIATVVTTGAARTI